MRGVSELVSAVITIIITLAAAAVIVSYAYSSVDYYTQRILQTSAEASSAAMVSASLVYSYIEPRGAEGYTLRAVVAVGGTPVEVLGVYINGTPASCVYTYSGAKLEAPLRVPPHALLVVECSVEGFGLSTVKVVFDRGWVEGYAALRS